MMGGHYIVRRMAPDELQIAVDWAREQGWNPGVHDARTFYAADPRGFFVGVLDGQPIATGAAVNYGDRYAFCGLYIVKEEFRGRGYGLQLTQERLKHTGPRTTGLDGVLAKVDKYKRLGYVEAHRNIRYSYKGERPFLRDSRIVNLASVPFSEVEAFDRRHFPAPRSGFLSKWIAQPDSFAVGYLVDQRLVGYGVARKCYNGYKVGPLFTADAAAARAIFEALALDTKQGELFLDCPEPNKSALELVHGYGMQPQFETIRMYRNGTPNVNIQAIFGITTFELG